MTPFPVLVYRATENNSQWLGPAPLDEVAAQVGEITLFFCLNSLFCFCLLCIAFFLLIFCYRSRCSLGFLDMPLRGKSNSIPSGSDCLASDPNPFTVSVYITSFFFLCNWGLTCVKGFLIYMIVICPCRWNIMEREELSCPPVSSSVYTATMHNTKDANVTSFVIIVWQVAECKGEAGHNIEYVLRLAEFFRDNLPEVVDEHLFTLESLVREKMNEKKLSLNGGLLSTKASKAEASSPHEGAAGDHPRQPEDVDEVRRDSFQYQARVPPKKLLCLNVWWSLV